MFGRGGLSNHFPRTLGQHVAYQLIYIKSNKFSIIVKSEHRYLGEVWRCNAPCGIFEYLYLSRYSGYGTVMKDIMLLKGMQNNIRCIIMYTCEMNTAPSFQVPRSKGVNKPLP